MAENEKIELKWYEKKQGITLEAKKKEAERKANKHAARKAAQKGEPVPGKTEKKPEKDASEQKKYFKKYTILDKSSLFNPAMVPQDAVDVIRKLDKLLDKHHYLTSKQKAFLPDQIRELSHFLTDDRAERRVGYMNAKEYQTAYVHYFFWWNLVRMTKLFSNMEPSFFADLKDGDFCADLGSGPLTVVISLFMARPELRKKKLSWYCLDISQGMLSFGENLFYEIAADLECEPWQIIRVKGDIGTELNNKAAFVTTANVFNELHDDETMPPDYLAKKYTDKVVAYIDKANPKAKILTIEPGTPKSARLLSLMRDSYMRKRFFPVAPCTHCSTCPMDGKDRAKGGKWCNFAFSTDDAPEKLKRLSEKANLPKDRAVLSFVACEYRGKLDELQSLADENTKKKKFSFRIASDPIHLPGNRTGYYACSERGLLLAVTDAKLFCGEKITINEPDQKLNTDTKSGAKIIDLENPSGKKTDFIRKD